ncbi:MAG TPA: hypothetical protein VHZ24_06895 [Pirellulales bacterium]|jgi:hypothetical protein|nr:hypothetical protein [Pirellulales bacterium]
MAIYDNERDAPETTSEAEHWSTALAREIAAERRRTATLAEAHRLKIDNLSASVVHEIDELLAGYVRTLSAGAAPSAVPVDPTDVVGPAHHASDERAHGPRHPVGEMFTAHDTKPHTAPIEGAVWRGNKLAAHAEPMDWESQKRRMLDSLDAEPETAHEKHDARHEERLTIEGTIRITDEVIAERDREISQLQARLAEQAVNHAEGPAEFARTEAVLQADEIISRERERLKHELVAVDEARRLAEIELSRERAKIARERAELEERSRVLQAELAQRDREFFHDGSTEQGKRPPRGRWLKRLGLKDDDAPGGTSKS